MSLNPISTLTTLTEVSSSQDVIMIMDASDTETKQILISEFNTAVQSNINVLSGSFLGDFQGDGSNLTGVTGEWDGSHLGDASITGSFTVSGSNSLVDFSNVEGGVSGSFSGSYSGSFNGDGSGLFNITIESASYIQSTGVDGPYGMDSILSASYAVSSSYTISSSYAVSSSSTINSSYALTASYYDGPSGVFTQTGSFYATTNDLQVTGSFDVDTPSSEQLTVNESMSVGGKFSNDGGISYELGPPLRVGNLNRSQLNLDIGGWSNNQISGGALLPGSNDYLYNSSDWQTSPLNNRNTQELFPFTGSQYNGQYIRFWWSDYDVNGPLNQPTCLQLSFAPTAPNPYIINGQVINNNIAGNYVNIQPLSALSGSAFGGIPTGLSGSLCEVYKIGVNEYFVVANGIPGF